MSTPHTVNKMPPSFPSEAAFLRQAELAQEALKNFLAIRALNTPSIIKPALHEVLNTTVRSFLFPDVFYLNTLS
jgi:hypothetical protein